MSPEETKTKERLKKYYFQEWKNRTRRDLTIIFSGAIYGIIIMIMSLAYYSIFHYFFNLK